MHSGHYSHLDNALINRFRTTKTQTPTPTPTTRRSIKPRSTATQVHVHGDDPGGSVLDLSANNDPIHVAEEDEEESASFDGTIVSYATVQEEDTVDDESCGITYDEVTPLANTSDIDLVVEHKEDVFTSTIPIVKHVQQVQVDAITEAEEPSPCVCHQSMALSRVASMAKEMSAYDRRRLESGLLQFVDDFM